MKIIPAIDLLDDEVIRLEKGNYDKKTVYSSSPEEIARQFKNSGFNHIHVVDLNGAREGTFQNLKTIRKMIENLDISVQMGGGIRSTADAELLMESGISKFICGSLAVRQKKEWLKLVEKYPENAILGMDLKDGQIAYSGWFDTSEETIESFLKPMIEKGLREVLCTDISRDGMLTGPNLQLYKDLQQRFPTLNFIASGGISNLMDLKKLKNQKLYAAVVGKAFYEGLIDLEEMALLHDNE